MGQSSGAKTSDRYFDILECLDSHLLDMSLKDKLVMISRQYDLQHIVYIGLNFPGRSGKLPVSALTYPEAWVERYISANFLQHDPVLKAGLSSLMPFSWDDLDLHTRRHRKIFGEASEFGISSRGMTFPVRGQHGDRALLSITLSGSAASRQRITRYLMRDFQILSHYIHASALRAENVKANNVKLAPREIEVLQWAALGKTSSEIAIILGIGEKTSRFYIELARHKLNAVNVTNAVAKAISLNLISVGL